jgi:PAB-dependent poly(A)-specific ribonuclease subunit 2
MPYYKSQLLSVWPKKMLFKVGRATPKIVPEVLAGMKMVDFVGYAAKPKDLKGNQSLALSYKQNQNTPLFHSQTLKDKAFGKSISNLDLLVIRKY